MNVMDEISNNGHRDVNRYVNIKPLLTVKITKYNAKKGKMYISKYTYECDIVFWPSYFPKCSKHCTLTNAPRSLQKVHDSTPFEHLLQSLHSKTLRKIGPINLVYIKALLNLSLFIFKCKISNSRCCFWFGFGLVWFNV